MNLKVNIVCYTDHMVNESSDAITPLESKAVRTLHESVLDFTDLAISGCGMLSYHISNVLTFSEKSLILIQSPGSCIYKNGSS